MTIWMGLYVGLLFLSIWLVHVPAFSFRPLHIAVTVLPVLPLFGVLGISMRKYRVSDELQKKIMAEGIIFGFGLTAIITLTLGFLQMSDEVPRVSYIWVWPILAMGWLIGTVIARLRYS